MRALGEAAQQPRDALEVGGRGGHDVDPAVGIVHPVDRHLVDTQPSPLSDHQQFGVEKPPGVPHQRQQPLGHITPHRLETALRVGESHGEGGAQEGVVAAEVISRLRPRTTREPGARRVPMATSECPEISGATSGSSAASSVDRSTSRYASTGARDCDQAARSARPRPFSASRSHCASGSSSASRAAICGVRSVLALSATVMRNG